MLKMLPNYTFPIHLKSMDPLTDMVVQFNFLDRGLTPNVQRALSLMLHTYDLWVKSKGKIDYRGISGHARMMQDAKTFVSGSAIATRTGDLPGAHLAIDYHDTSARCKEVGIQPLPNEVSPLLDMCMDLCCLTEHDEKEIGLLLDWLGKKGV